MSDSVEEIQACIARLSAEIEIQKEIEVLRQLEQSKSAAQRQLNSIRDPMTRLPFDISSQIFLQCLPSASPPNVGAYTAPILFLNVSNTWTDIALATHALWAAVHLDFQGSESCRVGLNARGIVRYPSRFIKACVTAVLRQYAPQLKNLEIYEEEQIVDVRSLPSFPCLESMTFGPPLDYPRPWKVSLAHITGLLRLAPKLVECTFDNIAFSKRANTSPKHILPCLLCLNLEVGPADPAGDYNRHGDDIIRHLSMPALKALTLPLIHLSHNDFSSFLKWDSPPLRKLALGCRTYNIGFLKLDEWLRRLPFLTDLELYTTDSSFASDLFSALAETPSESEFLPDLRSLKIRHHFPQIISRSSYQKLLHAFSVRRLVCFHFKANFVGDDANETRPHPDVCEQLRQLAVNGMDIYVGNKHENYISL